MDTLPKASGFEILGRTTIFELNHPLSTKAVFPSKSSEKRLFTEGGALGEFEFKQRHCQA